MKKKIFITFIVFFLSSGWLITAVNTAGSATDPYKIEIGLPGLAQKSAVTSPGQYIKYLFLFGLSLIGFLAVLTIAIAGIIYITAAGNPSGITRAKEFIVAAVSGIILLFCAYLLLSTIDPTLTDLTPPVLKKIDINQNNAK